MSDYIKRDDAIEKINNALKRVFVEDVGQEIIASIPSADVVPVVRCKDCKWMEKNVFGGQYCNYRYGNIRLDDFCSCGERKNNELQED